MKKFDVSILTLFPNFFSSIFQYSLFRRAREAEILQLSIINIRDFALDKHHKCDDIPYGGGSGMVLLSEPLWHALDSVFPQNKLIVAMSARGILLKQSLVHHLTARLGFAASTEKTSFTQNPLYQNLPDRWRQTLQGEAVYEGLVIVCGHYEGIDQRFLDERCSLELSIGDYVLMGGESAALVFLESLVRYVPGFLGNAESLIMESHDNYLLDFPQYTRPAIFQGNAVPEVLRNGHHAEIERWRFAQREKDTFLRRPDLYEKFLDSKSASE